MMDHAEYVGPIRELKGKKAIVQPDGTYELPLEQRTLQAQFDGTEDWRVGVEFKLKHPETGALLCYGWHKFKATDFRILVRA